MKHFLILITAIISVCFIACGSDDDNETSNVDKLQNQNKTNIIGKWVCKFYAPRYQPYREVAYHDTLSFNADGTYRRAYEQVNTPLTGTYKVDDSYLTLDGIHIYDIYFSKDTMILGEYGYDSDNYTYNYVRLNIDSRTRTYYKFSVILYD